MDKAETICLQRLPESESELESWAESVVDTLNGTIREREIAADQYCWRLSINHQHWLLFYSDLCLAAWIQPLEETDNEVIESLKAAGYVDSI